VCSPLYKAVIYDIVMTGLRIDT